MKKSGSTGKWQKRGGFRGVISHVYDGNRHVVVRGDLLSTKLRWRVLIYSREASRHEIAEEVRLEVLRHFKGGKTYYEAEVQKSGNEKVEIKVAEDGSLIGLGKEVKMMTEGKHPFR
jgi:hypothetical protein